MGHLPPGIRDCAPGIIPTGSRGSCPGTPGAPSRGFAVPGAELRVRAWCMVPECWGTCSLSAHPPVGFPHRGPASTAPFPHQRGRGCPGVPGAAPASAALPEHASYAATLRLAEPAGDQGTAGPYEIVDLGSLSPPDMLAIVIPWTPLLLLGYKMPTNIPDLAAPLKEHLVCWEEEAPRSRAFVPRDEPLL